MLAIPITYAYTKEAIKKANPEKLATYGTQYEAKQKHSTICLDTTMRKQIQIT